MYMCLAMCVIWLVLRAYHVRVSNVILLDGVALAGWDAIPRGRSQYAVVYGLMVSEEGILWAS